jgi:hypothetical protein
LDAESDGADETAELPEFNRLEAARDYAERTSLRFAALDVRDSVRTFGVRDPLAVAAASAAADDNQGTSPGAAAEERTRRFRITVEEGGDPVAIARALYPECSRSQTCLQALWDSVMDDLSQYPRRAIFVASHSRLDDVQGLMEGLPRHQTRTHDPVCHLGDE